MTQLIGVYGASGFGREVMPLVRASPGLAVFIDDDSNTHSLPREKVVDWQGFLDLAETDKRVVLAVADGSVRKLLADRCEVSGIGLADARAASMMEMDSVEIGEGAVISPFVTLTSDIKIGRCFHANIYSYVAHDCSIGDFVTFAPRVSCNGNVRIDDFAYIGTGAIIRQGTPDSPIRIGEGAVVGMGAVVTKSVPAGVTVIGNPARILEKR